MPLEKPASISDSDLGVIGEYWEPGKLLLDYDGEIPERICDLGWIIEKFGARVKNLYARRTKNGWHVIVNTTGTKLSPLAIVAIQAIMGSDYKRETFNLARALKMLESVPSFDWKEFITDFKLRRWQILFKEKLNGNIT